MATFDVLLSPDPSFWCLSCVRCIAQWCTYRGTNLLQGVVEVLVVLYCISEVITFSHGQPEKAGRARRSLYVLFGLQAACLAVANFTMLLDARLSGLAFVMNYMVPLTAISADLLMISYWVKTFYGHRERYVQAVNVLSAVCNGFLYTFSGVYLFLIFHAGPGKSPPAPMPLVVVLSGSLVLMSVCCLVFVVAFSFTFHTYQNFLPLGALRPLRRTLWAAGMSAFCYLLRSVVVYSYGCGSTWVLSIVANPMTSAVYSLLLIFAPSWVCVLSFSSRFMKAKAPKVAPEVSKAETIVRPSRSTPYHGGRWGCTSLVTSPLVV
eukprot:EG_transcript_9946